MFVLASDKIKLNTIFAMVITGMITKYDAVVFFAKVIYRIGKFLTPYSMCADKNTNPIRMNLREIIFRQYSSNDTKIRQFFFLYQKNV